MGEERVEALREVGELLAYLRQPDPPKGFRDLVDKALAQKILAMGPNIIKKAPCQQVILSGESVDLTKPPIQTRWPEDVGPSLPGLWRSPEARTRSG